MQAEQVGVVGAATEYFGCRHAQFSADMSAALGAREFATPAAWCVLRLRHRWALFHVATRFLQQPNGPSLVFDPLPLGFQNRGSSDLEKVGQITRTKGPMGVGIN